MNRAVLKRHLMLHISCCFTLVLLACDGKRTVVLSTTRDSDRTVASVVAYPDSLFGTVGADLVVKDSDGQILLSTNLLRSRDDIEDVRIEFSQLAFSDSGIRLESRGVHYKGPLEIPLNAANHKP